jgi:O-antigen/teichoic acid export membrane protein
MPFSTARPFFKSIAVRGALWSVLGFGVGQVIRFGTNLILTRLLAPDLFGLLGLVLTLIRGLTLFSDIGIRPSVVQNPRGDDPLFLNTAWTLQVIRGGVLWLGAVLIAWPLALYYHDQRLVWLIPILGLTTILEGFNSTSLATLTRRVETGRLVRLDLKEQIITVTVMMVLAYWWRNLWALVIGNLLGALLKLMWSHGLEPDHPNRFAWDRTAAQELFAFGRWIFLSTALMFLATQSDRLILGKLFSLTTLGVYTIAYTMAYLPDSVTTQVGLNVIFPVVSQQADLPRTELRQKILAKRRWILGGLIAILTPLICGGDRIITFLYDSRYVQAAWMLPILALGTWLAMLQGTMTPALLGLGKPVYGSIGNSLKFLYMIVAIPLGYQLGQEFGAIMAIALNDLPFYLVVNVGLLREGLSTLVQDLQATLLLLGVLALVMGGRYYLGFGLPIDALL